jgi:hypothetical protein
MVPELRLTVDEDGKLDENKRLVSVLKNKYALESLPGRLALN